MKITVPPEYSYMVETRIIDGRRFILIPADDGVEVNGIPVTIPNPQAGHAPHTHKNAYGAIFCIFIQIMLDTAEMMW